MTPFQIFKSWYNEEQQEYVYKIPSACCFSTIGIDGFPNARFISFKELKADTFIVTGPLQSRKGLEISMDNRAALTFWWPATERQVRIQGVLEPISEHEADLYFAERNRESQLVSLISEQGKEINNLKSLNNKFDELQETLIGQAIDRPIHWGGFALHPLRIEFLEFKDTRFHERTLYHREKNNDVWLTTYLQP